MTSKNIVARQFYLKGYSLCRESLFVKQGKRMKLFKMRKNWDMMGKIVIKYGRARFCLSCKYYCTLYFLVKVLLVKLKNLYTSPYLNLNYGTTKEKPKM